MVEILPNVACYTNPLPTFNQSYKFVAEISHSESIYTTEISKHYKPGLDTLIFFFFSTSRELFVAFTSTGVLIIHLLSTLHLEISSQPPLLNKSPNLPNAF